jgi:heme-degrading monooxygenase HmoA
MQARVTTAQFAPDKLDEGIQIYRQAVSEHYRDQPGFRGALLLVDRETSQGLSIALWESRDNVLENTWGGAYLEVLEEFAGLFAVRPSFQVYEVSVQV